MKVFEAIKFACYFSDENELAEKLDSLTNFPVNMTGFTDEEKKKLTAFLRHYRLIEEELAYLPFRKLQVEMLVHNDRIDMISFINKPLKILSIRDENGKKVKYKLFPTYIEVRASKVKIEYLPQIFESSYNSDLPERISGRVVAYGVTREYCLSQGLYEDAQIWENRYKDGVKLMLRREPCGAISARRWL